MKHFECKNWQKKTSKVLQRHINTSILWLKQVWSKHNAQVAGWHTVAAMVMVHTIKVKQQPGHSQVVRRVKFSEQVLKT